MRSQKSFDQYADRRAHNHLQSLKFAAISLLLLAATSAFALQDSPALQATSPKHAHHAQEQDQQSPSTTKKADLGEYGPLVTELAHLATKIQQGVTLPPPRTQSKLLPLLPASTSVYFSTANFGETLYQANQIFNQELHDSTVLNDWWQSKAGMAGMMAEAAIEQIHQFTGYLGDEIVVSAAVKEKGGSFVLLAEIKKPGLKAFLQQTLEQYGGKNAPVEILTPQQLLTAKAPGGDKKLVMLVRSDFLIASSDLSTLRSLNARLSGSAATFASTPFGQRLAQEYQGGVSMLLGADVQKLLALRPQGQPQVEAVLEKMGVANLKYAIVDGKVGGGISSSSSEVTFNGPRRGIFAWLAAPTNLASLDFVSANPVSAGAIALEPLSQIFDDIKAIADSANPMASSGLTQMENELGIDLRNDLFSKFSGQFALATEDSGKGAGEWKVIAQVSDPDGLQKTFKQLLEAMNEKSLPGKGSTMRQETEDGLTYSSIGFLNGAKQDEVDYTFADGYLLVAHTPAALKQAIEAHHSGNSLAKSGDFLKLLPQEHGAQASVVIFQNAALGMKAMASVLPPEVMQLLQALSGQTKYNVMAAYGEPTAIRATSNSQQFNVAVPLVIAAIAIPNLMRSRSAANDAAAAVTIRTINVAQVSYQETYGKGFAPDLGTLGGGSGGGDCGGKTTSAEHACLLDLGPGCSGTSCTKNGFEYTMTASCGNNGCEDYVVTGTPVDPGKGGKSFCSTSDVVVRTKPGAGQSAPASPAECQTWNPI